MRHRYQQRNDVNASMTNRHCCQQGGKAARISPLFQTAFDIDHVSWPWARIHSPSARQMMTGTNRSWCAAPPNNLLGRELLLPEGEFLYSETGRNQYPSASVRPWTKIADKPEFLTLARLVLAHRSNQCAIAIDWLGLVGLGLHPADFEVAALAVAEFKYILNTAAAERRAEKMASNKNFI